MPKAAKQPFSIRMYLPDGDSEGLRIIGKSNWTGAGVVFTRTGYKDATKRNEFSRTGVYVLVGSNDVSTLPTVYIGEGDPVGPRLRSHYANKEFWDWCIFFISNDASLNKAHVKYLEHTLISMAQDAKKCILDNLNTPTPPTLSEPDEADMQSFLQDMLKIFPLIGLSVFEQPKRLSKNHSPMLFIEAKGITARGQETNEGFLVFKDSQILGETAPSIPGWISSLRKDIEAQSVITPLTEKDTSHFLHDYAFKSPSAAAGVILGRAANGRTEWKTSEGKPLIELQSERASLSNCTET